MITATIDTICFRTCRIEAFTIELPELPRQGDIIDLVGYNNMTPQQAKAIKAHTLTVDIIIWRMKMNALVSEGATLSSVTLIIGTKR